MTRRFECVEEGAAKFWELAVQGTEVNVRYGKLGTDGQSKTKDHGSPAAAEKEADKLIREKTKKGYVEVGAAVATDELSVFRSAEAQALRDALGELRVLDAGEEPEGLGGFRTLALDGDTWARVFEGIEWLFEEADGGAIGRYRTGPKCVVYMDNEGQFRLSPTLVDHLVWKDHDGEWRSEIERLVAKHGLPAPASEPAAAVKGLPTPDDLFEQLRATAAEPKPPKARAAAPKARAAQPKAAPEAPPVKGPRPLCRSIQTTFAPDGTLYTLSEEDFGGAYGETLTKGATFRFDLPTSSFVRLPAQPRGEYGRPLAHFACWSFAPEACLDGEAWRERGLVELSPKATQDGVARRLSDGTWLLLAGTEKLVYRYAGGTLRRFAELPEVRSGDEIVELGGGRALLANGTRSYTRLTSTLLLDLADGTVTPGPPIPGGNATFGRARGRAFVLHGYAGNEALPATLSILDGDAWAAHPAPEGLFHPDRGLCYTPVCALSSGEVLMSSWRDMSLATLDLDARTLTPAGAPRTNRTVGRGVELGDGRVLLVGGTLFDNVDAEPELWDPATRTTSCLPGYDKEVAKQQRELVRYLEKQAKKGR